MPVSRRHHRSPAVAMKPAGQDPESVDCAQGPHSNALLAAEIQSFLDHLIAGFRQSRASNDARVRPRTWEVRPAGINLRLPQGPEMVRLRRTDLRGLAKRRPLGGRSHDLASLFHVRNESGGAAVELLGAGCRDHKDSNPKPEQ